MALLPPPASGAQQGTAGTTGCSALTSVGFAGVDSLEVFIFFWGWKVFDGVKRIFGFKVIYRKKGRKTRTGQVRSGLRMGAKAEGLGPQGCPHPSPAHGPTHPGTL